MRRITVAPILLSLACGLAFAGCRGTSSEQKGIGATAGGFSFGDTGLDEFIPQLKAFTEELAGKVESSPDPSVGVAEAQKLLDARRDELTARIAALKQSAQMKDAAARGRWLEAEVDNTDRVHRLQVKYSDASTRDPVFKARLDKLVADYDALFRDR